MDPDLCRSTHLQSKGQWLTPTAAVCAFHSLDAPAGENGRVFFKFRPREGSRTHRALEKREGSRRGWGFAFLERHGAAVLAGMGLAGSASPSRRPGYGTERQACETL